MQQWNVRQLTQSPGRKPAATAMTLVTPTRVIRNAASLRTLGFPMRSGFLIPTLLSSPMNTFRRSSCSRPQPHFGIAPSLSRASMALSMSTAYSFLCAQQGRASCFLGVKKAIMLIIHSSPLKVEPDPSLCKLGLT